MQIQRINQIGFWTGIVLVALGIAYLGLILAVILLGSGFPPHEPYQTLFNLLILLTATWMVFFWVILNRATPAERKIFSELSLALIVIFAALTSINRYVGLTVVRQSLATGNTNGLQWFLPYSWPSVMLAVEYLAWGFFFGLACICLAPVFRHGRLEGGIFWTLMATGLFSLLAVVGQVIGSNFASFSPFTLAGVLAWGPGLTAAVLMISIWFYRGSHNVQPTIP